MTHRSEASVTLRDPAGIAGEIASHLVGHGGVLRQTSSLWELEFTHRNARLQAEGTTLHLVAEGGDPSLLQEMRLDLAEHLAEFGGPQSLDWSGEPGPEGPPNFRLLQVVQVEVLTPLMRRITLAGPHLLRFASLEALHVKLLFPPDGEAPVWPYVDARGRFQAGNGRIRKYTIRSLDPAAGLMVIDFVLHDPAGPGSRWAGRAAPGDLLGLMGPGGAGIPLQGPALLLGDETALPAILRALEAMADGTGVTALIEIADPCEEQAVITPAGAKLHWLHRNGAPAGELLAREALALAPPAGMKVWAGCEFAAFKAIRAGLRKAGHPRADHFVTAYWRRGVAGEKIESGLARLSTALFGG